jgi:putative methionine-R-sulfoxide reductase with GAF domain
VFDADSHDTESFSESDVAGLYRVFVQAGLTPARPHNTTTEVV